MYFVSKILLDVDTHVTMIMKIAYAVVVPGWKLCLYFDAWVIVQNKPSSGENLG